MASIYRVLPKTMCALCQSFDAWIVGGAVEWIDQYLTSSSIIGYPNDFDVVVNHENWNKACKILPLSAVINSCGGFKFTESFMGRYIEIDVWMDEVGNLATLNEDFSAYHPRTKTFLAKVH